MQSAEESKSLAISLALAMGNNVGHQVGAEPLSLFHGLW